METMQINCPVCGNACEVEDELTIGQHLFCPFCSAKLAYAGNQQDNKSHSDDSQGGDARFKIVVKCPSCEAEYEVDEESAGETCQCGVCNTVFAVEANGVEGEKNIDSDASESPETGNADVMKRDGAHTSREVRNTLFSEAMGIVRVASEKISLMLRIAGRRCASMVANIGHAEFYTKIKTLVINGNKSQFLISTCGMFALLSGILIWSHLTSKTSAGTVKTITLPGGATMDLVYCPPGEFMMGSPVNEEGRASDETQHRVVLTKGFWIGKYEVTQEQWESVMGSNPSAFRGKVNPVEKVSCDDCRNFFLKVGGGLRLPTEAEWEYACRAGSTDAFAGTGNINDMGWIGENHHEVGQKTPNAWGIHDMHGNVMEWCCDCYGDYPNGVVTNPIGPVTLSGNSPRVQRGGAYAFQPRICRSASRYQMRPNGSKFAWEGFRVACKEDAPILDPSFKNISDSNQETGGEVDSAEYRGSRKFVKEHIKKYDNCRVCTLTQRGGDIVVCGDNNWASSRCSRRITEELQKISDSGQRIIDVTLTEGGKFIVLYGVNAASWNSIPRQMEGALRTCHDNYEELYSATMNDAGDWILVTSEHFACSETWLKKWVADGRDEYGRLRAAVVTDDAAVAVFDEGFMFLGDVPSDLKESLKEADFDVRIVKIAGEAWFFANADGSRYSANM